MQRFTILRLIGVCLTLSGAASGPAGAQSLTLVINPRTGQTRIQNVGNSAVNLDGYLLASEGAFNTAGWSSLQDQAVGGWREGNPNANHLAESNLLSSTPLATGASRNLGAAYTAQTPTAIGQAELPVSFDFHVAGGA